MENLHPIEKRYRERITELEKCLADIETLYKHLIRSDMQFQYFQYQDILHTQRGGLPLFNPYSEQIEACIEVIKETKLKIIKARPCVELAQRFGWEFHEAYKAKYPLDGETTITDYKTLEYRSSITYVVQEPFRPTLPSETPPEYTPLQTYIVPFQRWCNHSGEIIHIAYASHLNQVIVLHWEHL